MSERRTAPCQLCSKPILVGARKCKFCKGYQPERPRAPRAAIMMFMTLTSVFSVIVTTERSTVEEAPPLTQLAGDPPELVAKMSEDPITPPEAPQAESPTVKRNWKTREIKLGDVRPLDLAFSGDGASLYVSADDATIREIRIDTGEIVHKASVQAKGDHVSLVGDRFLVVLNDEPTTATVPVLDVTRWDKDPTLLEVGRGPSHALEMPDGSLVVGTSVGHQIGRFTLPSGALTANLTLPHATGQIFLVSAGNEPTLGALGSMSHAGRPAGAWLDLFDPNEKPFGATRRSVAVGRDPRVGAVTSDGRGIFFPDAATNEATLIEIGELTQTHQVAVGQGPIAAFVFAGDRVGLTLNALSRTATVVPLGALRSDGLTNVSTLMFEAEPRMGRISPDRNLLYVALGGHETPPRGKGVAIVGGDPPEIIASLPTGQGAISVGVSKDGLRAAVANYFSKSITIVE